MAARRSRVAVAGVDLVPALAELADHVQSERHPGAGDQQLHRGATLLRSVRGGCPGSANRRGAGPSSASDTAPGARGRASQAERRPAIAACGVATMRAAPSPPKPAPSLWTRPSCGADGATPEQTEGPSSHRTRPSGPRCWSREWRARRSFCAGGCSTPPAGRYRAPWSTSGRPTTPASTTTRLPAARPPVQRRRRRLPAAHHRPRALHRPHKAHPRQGAAARRTGADHPALLPRRAGQRGRRHLRPAAAGRPDRSRRPQARPLRLRARHGPSVATF